MADEIYVKHNYCNDTVLLPNKLENGNLYFVRDDGVYFDLYNERRKIGPVINDSDSTFTDVDESSVPTSGVVKEAIEDSNSWQSGATQGKVLSANDNGSLQWVDPSSMNYWTYQLTPWEEIISNQNYATDYQIGKLVNLDFGEYGVHQMELVAMDVDDKADESGKARMTWISKDIVAMQELPSNYMHWTDNNPIREWMRTTLLSQMPSELQKAIVDVNKTYAITEQAFGEHQGTTTSTTTDSLWIPSVREVFGESVVYDGTTYNIYSEDSGPIYNTTFKNDASRIKKYNSTNISWATRSSFKNESAYNDAMCVRENGAFDFSYNVRTSIGIVIGFCI